jgi:hypothetical protein
VKFSFQSVLNYLGYFLLAVVLFGAGFYFGYKNATASIQANSDSTTKAVENVAKTIVDSSQTSSSTNTSSVKPTTGVYWIKSGQQPVCPQEYSIKGKFDSPASFYYMKDNKQYDRVKADICFASEEVARDVAGFIRKY